MGLDILGRKLNLLWLKIFSVESESCYCWDQHIGNKFKWSNPSFHSVYVTIDCILWRPETPFDAMVFMGSLTNLGTNHNYCDFAKRK